MSEEPLNLRVDVAMPKTVAARLDAWERITTGTSFFDSVKRATEQVSTDDLAVAGAEAAKWSDWFQYLQPRISRRDKRGKGGTGERFTPENLRNWHGEVVRARALVWCAQQALATPEVFQRVVNAPQWFGERLVADGVGSPLDQFLNSEEHKPWVWLAIRTLLDVPSRTVSEPVVFWNQAATLQRPASELSDRSTTDADEGVLATLVLDVLGSREADGDDATLALAGVGQVAHHPADAFAWHQHEPEFRASLDRAWRSAQTLYQARNPSYRLFDARWRLVDQPHDPVDGPSASGAAARGWYCALENQVEDSGVITLAEVNKDDVRLLNGVNGVAAKVGAIAKAGRFDTIAVATARNKSEAEAALGKQSAIRVVNFSTSN